MIKEPWVTVKATQKNVICILHLIQICKEKRLHITTTYAFHGIYCTLYIVQYIHTYMLSHKYLIIWNRWSFRLLFNFIIKVFTCCTDSGLSNKYSIFCGFNISLII